MCKEVEGCGVQRGRGTNRVLCQRTRGLKWDAGVKSTEIFCLSLDDTSDHTNAN